jgi:hydroxyacid-oxoacid transhydrogenase
VEHSGYLMLYTATGHDREHEAAGVIGAARSTNLIDWEAIPPITEPAEHRDLEVPQPLRIADRWYLLYCTRWHSEARLARTGPSGQWFGTHYLVSDHLAGPYRLTRDEPLLGDEPGTYYAGRVVEGPDGGPVFLAWRQWGADGSFAGALSNPARLHVDADGHLRIDSRGLWPSEGQVRPIASSALVPFPASPVHAPTSDAPATVVIGCSTDVLYAHGRGERMAEARLESVFTMDTSAIKFGAGADGGGRERSRGPGLRPGHARHRSEPRRLGGGGHADRSLREAGIDVVRYDEVRVEPTDRSFLAAIAAATESGVDSFVAVGGGSVIDTAKAANLYATYPPTCSPTSTADRRGRAGPRAPQAADRHPDDRRDRQRDDRRRHLRPDRDPRQDRDRPPGSPPTLGILDPLNTVSMPAVVTRVLGARRAQPRDRVVHRPPLLGATGGGVGPAPPRLPGGQPYQRRVGDPGDGDARHPPAPVMEAPDDLEARGQMMLAAAYAGIGFGTPVSTCPRDVLPRLGMVRSYRPEGFAGNGPIVPHGMSVILNAPAVFRFTAPSDRARHLEAARCLGADVTGASLDDAGDILAAGSGDHAADRDAERPGEVGFTEADVDALVAGTVPQHRVTKLSSPPGLGGRPARSLPRRHAVLVAEPCSRHLPRTTASRIERLVAELRGDLTRSVSLGEMGRSPR